MPPSAPVTTTRALPDLGDTRIAFGQYGRSELLRAYWLFRIIGIPWMSAMGRSLSQVALALHLPVKGLIKLTLFNHFCGGETIEESLLRAVKLKEGGIGTILDYSVEGQEDDETLDHTTAEILRTIAAAKGRTDIPFCVFKPSGISPVHLLTLVSKGKDPKGDDAREWKLVNERLERICSAAAEAGIPVLIDAEESWMQAAIDAMATRMMEKFNRERAIVFNTVQHYRHDRLEYLKRAHHEAERSDYQLGVKLVRGAYMEKERAAAVKEGRPSPIHIDKAAVDRDYDVALRFCAKRLDRINVCAGTHNEQSTLLLAGLLDELGIARNDRRVWFAQLLGMSDNISYNMAAAGYNVAKYVPYGPVGAVLPYLIRRAAENTSVAGQMSRELKLIVVERKRRARA